MTESPWREKLHEIIFEADTAAGKAFDVALLIAILVSVLSISLQTVQDINETYGQAFIWIERTVTVLFTIEYALRIICVRKPAKYIFSFFGIVDLLSILPTYFGWISHQERSRFAIVRSLRLLRVFRVLNLGWLVEESDALRQAIWKSRAKIVVFLSTVLIVVTISGTLIFEVENLEGRQNAKLDSIPAGIYWAIVTMTTVGYGDVVATSAGGKIVTAVLILLGYSLIIVPTGFVSAELTTALNSRRSLIACRSCLVEGHDRNAKFCDQCGEKL